MTREEAKLYTARLLMEQDGVFKTHHPDSDFMERAEQIIHEFERGGIVFGESRFLVKPRFEPHLGIDPRSNRAPVAEKRIAAS